MRIYLDEDKKELAAVICNKCRRELTVEKGIVKEGCFYADIQFGYFSSKDGKKHSFDLCEECYDKMIARFQIPVDESAVRELL